MVCSGRVEIHLSGHQVMVAGYFQVGSHPKLFKVPQGGRQVGVAQ